MPAMRKYLFALGCVAAMGGGLSLLSCTLVSQSQRMAGDAGAPDALLEVNLRRHVAYLSQDCAPRDGSHPAHLSKAAMYLAQGFRASGGRVDMQSYRANGHTYSNVRCVFQGREEARLIVGASYDAFGSSPGADDNASGAAGLVELARLLKGIRPQYTVELVAYANGQEPWFKTAGRGSAHHSRMMKESGTTVHGMICLRSIGFFSDLEKSQTYPNRLLSWQYPDKGDFIAVLGNLSSMPLSKRVQDALLSRIPVARLNLPDMTGVFDHADQYSYWRYNMPAVLVTDTLIYRNANNRQSTDTAGTLDYRRMSRVVQGVATAVRKLSR